MDKLNQTKKKSKKQQQKTHELKVETDKQLSKQQVNHSIAQNKHEQSLKTTKMDTESYMDKELNKKIVNDLKACYILALKKPNQVNSQAKYYCTICNFFINTLEAAQKHKINVQHVKKFEKINILETKLFTYKIPNKLALNELTNHLIDVYKQVCPTQDEIKHRYEVFSQIKLKLLQKYPSGEINLYGSTSSGCCLIDSSLDIDVHFESVSTSETLATIQEQLTQMNDIFTNDFINGPNFRLTAKTKDGLIVNFSKTCPKYWHYTSHLCRLYSRLDDRVNILSTCFRYLAKIAQLDKPDLNTLPSHSFNLMTIYFLQTIKPCVLPCLHEQLLNDPFDSEIDSIEFLKKCNDYVNTSKWKSNNCDEIGLLWLKMLMFYSIDYTFSENFITLRTTKKITKSSVKYFGKKFSIEDPFNPKQNLCRSLLVETNDYLFSTIRNTCCYYFDNLIKYDADSSLFNLKFIDELVKQIDELNIKDYVNFKDISDIDLKKEVCLLFKIDYLNLIKSKKRSISECVDINVKTNQTLSRTSLSICSSKDDDIVELIGDLKLSQSSEDESESNDEVIIKSIVRNIIENVAYLTESINLHIPIVGLSERYLLNNSNKQKVFNLKFELISFGIEKRGPPLVCTFCNKEGHLSRDCPQDSLPKPLELPKISTQWDAIISKVCIQIMENNRQTKEEERSRNDLLELLRKVICQKYPDAQLRLFGSSGNGFSTKKSDLDICMTLDRYPIGHEIRNEKVIMKDVEKLLRSNRDFDSIEFRGRAKVPIVKFRHKKLNIEGDISFYNTLGLHNTNLLKSYVKIDSRLQILGYVVKYFAKTCNIGDASCGSLSSYAYIIMMIHYLMKCEPPILPCLQKLTCVKHKEQNVNVDGWNCWYYPDIDNVANIWEHYGKNKQTIGELWLGFLKYYTEQFDWKNNVINIRTNEVLTRKTKGWLKSRMNIEDPFELSHNLASGVSDKMSIFILKTFQLARTHFSTENDLKNDLNYTISYFFNTRSIIEGAPPMDRCCYNCNRIGHITRDCPNLDLTNGKLNPINKSKQTASLQCFKCNEIGHISRDCPQKLAKKQISQQSQLESPTKYSSIKHSQSLQSIAYSNYQQIHQIQFNGYNNHIYQPNVIYKFPQVNYYQNVAPIPIATMPQSFHFQQHQQQQQLYRPYINTSQYSHYVPQFKQYNLNGYQQSL